MDRLDAMQLFIQIADTGQFSRAADFMHMPRSTASSTIRQLERYLNVRLFHRTTRSVALTEEGVLYLAHCREILGQLEQTETLLQGRAAGPAGTLRADIPSRLIHLIAPEIGAFMARYPALEIQLGVADQAVDLVAGAVDCALRVGTIADSSLVARQIGMLTQGNFASPAYLSRYGEPKDLESLANHCMVGFAGSFRQSGEGWRYSAGGIDHYVPVPTPLTVNSAEAYLVCARAGLGLIQLPRYDVADDVSAGRLVEVLPAYRPADLPLSFVYPHRRHVLQRVRVFEQWLLEVLSPRLLG